MTEILVTRGLPSLGFLSPPARAGTGQIAPFLGSAFVPAICINVPRVGLGVSELGSPSLLTTDADLFRMTKVGVV